MTAVLLGKESVFHFSTLL